MLNNKEYYEEDYGNEEISKEDYESYQEYTKPPPQYEHQSFQHNQQQFHYTAEADAQFVPLNPEGEHQ